MVKKVNMQVVFQENCEYKKSSTKKNINIQPQSVEIDVTITNKSHNDQNLPHYFNDILEVQAHVYQHNTSNGNTKDIQKGRIEFYYKPDDSRNPRVLLNPNDTCILDKQGHAAIRYKPNKNGKFIAKYVDNDGWYNSIEKSIHCSLQPIPVNIRFTQKPAYVTSLQDSIKLEVCVTDKLNENNLIDYGVVTFLHYSEHFDMDNPQKRIERVIGNPVPVINGKASIKYIPVQEYSNTEIEDILKDGTEYIRAIYNYDNDLYYHHENDTYSYESVQQIAEYQTNKWQYYGSANVYTNIEIYQPNSVIIGIADAECVDGIYKFRERSNIVITATIFNEENEEIVLDIENGDTPDFTFHITGTYPILQKDYPLYTEDIIDLTDNNEYVQYHTYTYDYDYDTGGVTYEIIEDELTEEKHGYFKKQIRNLRPGYYTIQGSTNGQIIKGEVLLYPTSDAPVTSDTYTRPIKDSNIIYIRSEYAKTNYHTLTTNLSVNNNCNLLTNNIIYTNTDISCGLRTVITAQNANDNNADTLSILDIFDNKKCIFYCVNNQTSYEGTLSLQNNTLIGTPDSEIIFTQSDDYKIYAYIPVGYYMNSDRNALYRDIFMDYQTSNPLIIPVRDKLSVDIDVTCTPNQYTYASVSYEISAHTRVGYSQNVIIRLLDANSQKLGETTYTFTELNDRYTGQFNNLLPGSYRITAISEDGIVTVEQFSIYRDLLKNTLPNTSRTINANPFSTVELVLSSSNNNMNLLERNNNKIQGLQIFLEKKGSENVTEITNYSIKQESNKNIRLEIYPNIYTDDSWYIWTKYIGDDNFNAIECAKREFSTTRITPDIQIENTSTNTMNIVLANNVNNINIIGKIAFYNGNTLISDNTIFVTKPNGVCSITGIPSNCNNLIININPKDQTLMNVFSQSNYVQELRYNSNYNVIGDTTDIAKIKEQYDSSNNICLFPLYDGIRKSINRNMI